ncbi:hypothetical protein N9O51_05030 [Saprospiraceae bacterium]|nr:hypothetical protein [Saprospiraceae bacterium]
MMNERLLSIKTQNNNNKLNEISVADRIEFIELKLESINTELKGNPDKFISIMSLYEQSGFKKLVLAFPIIECIDYLQDEYFKLAETYYYSDKNSFYSQIDYYKSSEALQSTVDNNDLYNLVNSIVHNGAGLARLYTEISKTKNTNRLELKIKHTLRDVDTFYDESIFSSIQYKTIADFYVDKEQIVQESDLANYAIDDTTGNYVDYRSAELLYNYENLLKFISKLQKDFHTLTNEYYVFDSTDLNTWRNNSLDDKKGVSTKFSHVQVCTLVYLFLRSENVDLPEIKNYLPRILKTLSSGTIKLSEGDIKDEANCPLNPSDSLMKENTYLILDEILNVSKINFVKRNVKEKTCSEWLRAKGNNSKGFNIGTKKNKSDFEKNYISPLIDLAQSLSSDFEKEIRGQIVNLKLKKVNYYLG